MPRFRREATARRRIFTDDPPADMLDERVNAFHAGPGFTRADRDPTVGQWAPSIRLDQLVREPQGLELRHPE